MVELLLQLKTAFVALSFLLSSLFTLMTDSSTVGGTISSTEITFKKTVPMGYRYFHTFKNASDIVFEIETTKEEIERVAWVKNTTLPTSSVSDAIWLWSGGRMSFDTPSTEFENRYYFMNSSSTFYIREDSLLEKVRLLDMNRVLLTSTTDIIVNIDRLR